MGDMDFIRVSPERAMSFTVGSEPIGQWVIMWNPDKEAMCLMKKKDEALPYVKTKFLELVSPHQNKAQVIVTWNQRSKMFNVLTKGVKEFNPDSKMVFFVTRLNDPNFICHHFQIPLGDTMVPEGLDIACDVELPDRFSVYTKKDFDRYNLRIMR
jgi:hypothetical protein